MTAAPTDLITRRAGDEPADNQPIVSEVSITSSSPTDNPRLQPRGANGRFVKEDAEADELPADRYLDREISWLQFNERVLQLAADESIPLLERARYLAIFTSNLDEFFMVRVAGLKRRIATGIAVRSASGLEPREVLEQIAEVSHELMDLQSRVFAQQVRPALEEEGITIVDWADLSEDEQSAMGELFMDRIFPVLTPLAVDPAHPFPYISGLSLNLAVLLTNPKTGKEHFARVKVPPLLPRLLEVGDSTPYGARLLPIEHVIAAHLDQLFPGMQVDEHFTFRVTRNEDLEVEEDDAENLLKALEKELLRRRFGQAVRLEVEEDISKRVLKLLVRELGVRDDDVLPLPAPLDLTGLNVIHDLDRPHLKYKKFVPVTAKGISDVESASMPDIFAAIRRKEVLVHHPYESFATSVQHFIRQAAEDPKVLAIKQT
ncbi:MAG: polyphosphate kinase, partial [Intrasporangiaceae bacterium]|nr:polyphosphate kinase [Intrasporangiaceae bacterium]